MVLLSLAGTEATAAQRSVEGTVVTSEQSPAVTVVLDPAFTYVGSQRFVINLVADADQHLFVEATDSVIRRLYWVQFEGYRDRWRRYDYSTDSAIVVDDRTLYVDFAFYPSGGFTGSPGSDGDHARRLLEREGYRLPEHLGRVRLVWLWDEQARHEVMVIYVEDLEPLGLSVDALRHDEPEWRAVQAKLLERALAGLAIRSGSPP